MRRLALAALLASALGASGCTVDTALSGGFRLSSRLADACVEHCHTLNMRLAAVVVVANSGGCVCEPLDRAAQTGPGGAAVAGGAAVQTMRQQAGAAANASGSPHH